MARTHHRSTRRVDSVHARARETRDSQNPFSNCGNMPTSDCAEGRPVSGTVAVIARQLVTNENVCSTQLTKGLSGATP